MKKKTVIALIALHALTSGCKDGSAIQKQFIADRDRCVAKADNFLGIYFPLAQGDSYYVSPKEQKTVSNSVYCECMKDSEWTAYGCPKPKKDGDAPKPPSVAPAPVPVPVPAPVAPPPPVATQTENQVITNRVITNQTVNNQTVNNKTTNNQTTNSQTSNNKTVNEQSSNKNTSNETINNRSLNKEENSKVMNREMDNQNFYTRPQGLAPNITVVVPPPAEGQ